jgi:hypothetical protein
MTEVSLEVKDFRREAPINQRQRSGVDDGLVHGWRSYASRTHNVSSRGNVSHCSKADSQLVDTTRAGR